MPLYFFLQDYSEPVTLCFASFLPFKVTSMTLNGFDFEKLFNMLLLQFHIGIEIKGNTKSCHGIEQNNFL